MATYCGQRQRQRQRQGQSLLFDLYIFHTAGLSQNRKRDRKQLGNPWQPIVGKDKDRDKDKDK